jgi:polyhydroxyalkanoate synthase
MNTGAHIRDDLPRDGTRLADSLVALAAAVGTRPVEALQSLHRSGVALLDVAIGRSTVEPAAGDRRFDDPAWQGNPLYRGLMHSHLALVREAQRLAGELDLSPRDEARTRMALGMVADTLAPTNTLLGNPAALRRTLDTGGRNLLDGARNLVTDWRDNGGLPAMVDGTAFGVGENLAVTPGSVVYRHAMLELVQYRPQTQKVHGTPLFIVPPQINKYYIWDLAPGRSLIEHLVQQGFQVFVVSWFDPGAEQSGWGLEDYVLALEEAMQAVRDISRAP